MAGTLVSTDPIREVLEQPTYTDHPSFEQVPWGSVKDERTRMIESNPYVLVGTFNLRYSRILSHSQCIVGAGQTGLNIASRLKQMDIPTLILERSSRVGDVWRERYPTLVLHTPRPHHSRTSPLFDIRMENSYPRAIF